MRETDIQSKIVKAIEEAGGAAEKLANKYKRGIADLLIQLPGYDALLAEIKFDLRPARLDTTIRLKATELQRQFLARFERAGMQGCIISVLHSPARNYQIRDYWIGIFPSTQQTAKMEDYNRVLDKFGPTMVFWLEQWLMRVSK